MLELSWSQYRQVVDCSEDLELVELEARLKLLLRVSAKLGGGFGLTILVSFVTSPEA